MCRLGKVKMNRELGKGLYQNCRESLDFFIYYISGVEIRVKIILVIKWIIIWLNCQCFKILQNRRKEDIWWKKFGYKVFRMLCGLIVYFRL